jgi:hypothetical protein
MAAEDWLVLIYGEPNRRETRSDGGKTLYWVYTRHTQEHRPDPHHETYTETAWVRLDTSARIIEAGIDDTTSRDG